MIHKKIIEKLNRCDIDIVGIIPTNNYKQIINKIDGLILPGGSIISDKDIEIIKYAYEINKPTLGICLGMQEMALALDGEIEKIDNLIHYQDKSKYTHSIKIRTDSKLYKFTHNGTSIINSHHLYKVKNTKLAATGQFNGIIELIESKTRKFFIGVQWHPENLNDEFNNKIFDYFIESCRWFNENKRDT